MRPVRSMARQPQGESLEGTRARVAQEAWRRALCVPEALRRVRA